MGHVEQYWKRGAIVVPKCEARVVGNDPALILAGSSGPCLFFGVRV